LELLAMALEAALTLELAAPLVQRMTLAFALLLLPSLNLKSDDPIL
jgi:hypothetical protein